MPLGSGQPNIERRKRALFEAALKRPEAERRAFIGRETRDDPSLGEAVMRLLTAGNASQEGLLDHPVNPRQWPAGPTLPREVGGLPVVRHLGNGGMGCVYACRYPGSSELVAVKIIRSDLQSDRALQHFERERALLTRLTHPNVCRILTAGVSEVGAPFIVMEFIDGEPIDVFCAQRKLSVEQRLWLFSQVLAGVEYFHQQQVVHRDLKPSNIVVTSAGCVKVLDFGIAKLIDHEPGATGHGPTQTERPLMTLRYASPEQLGGLLSGRSSDIYALGVICYELLTGQHPLGAKYKRGRQELLAALLRERLTAPSAAAGEAWKGMPATLVHSIDLLVMNALAVSPERRYRSVAQLLLSLRQCLEQFGAPPRR